MAVKTSIEWTDAKWTPIRARHKSSGKLGWHCTHVTPGCEHCYSESLNLRVGTGLPFKPGHEKAIELFLDEKMLLAPLCWKKPHMIFVCSMTDLFADFVPVEWIDKLFAVMALCPQHTFQVLTKRSKRMKKYVTVGGPTLQQLAKVPQVGRGMMTANTEWPLPNIWLGVSCEDQVRADKRIPCLLATPAAVRFVSAEPLLGPIDFSTINAGRSLPWNTLRAGFYETPGHIRPRLDWIIAGGESGTGARPMHPDWVRGIRDQCAAAGTAFFFKQWGKNWPAEIVRRGDDGEWWRRFPDGEAWYLDDHNSPSPPQVRFSAIGNNRAGRLLDGVEHNAMPVPRPGRMDAGG